MPERPLYIFDVDGTLCDCSHRIHFLLNKEDPERWRKFYAACDSDLPVWPALWTMQWLSYFADIWLWTGRSSEVRDLTIRWFTDYTAMDHGAIGDALRMREVGDHRPDHVLKREWLEAMAPVDRERLVAVFEDRSRVVAMWRAAGISCFQVAEGGF